jgi:RNA polymerase sigma factor (sigma-70 family)
MGPQLRAVLANLHRLFSRQPAGGLTDAELLRRYVAGRDEAAFEALVWRHGQMVLGVCRRIVRGEQDAEDAFQATFLAFARSAGSITRRESAAGWLYRVACRVARRARARAARHALAPLPDVADPSGDAIGEAAWRDLRPVLDEEVGRLPAKYRAPFLLCYLEGRTNEEAAQELGWPKGTVATRLAGARQRLRARLTRRGVTLGAGLVALGLAGTAPAAPAPLVLATTRAALAFAGGAARPLVSESVLTLTRGVLKTMFLTRLSFVAAVLLAAGLAVTAATAAARHFLPGQPEATATRHAGAPAPPAGKAPARPAAGRLLFYRAGHLTVISPDGKDEKKVSKDRAKFHPGPGWLSPDGKRVAFLVPIEGQRRGTGEPRLKVYVRGLDEPEPGTDLGVEAQMLAWSPDGKQLVATSVDVGEATKKPECVHWLVDVKTRVKRAPNLPANQFVTDWSRDGNYFLTTELDLSAKPPVARLHLVSRDGTEDRKLTDGSPPAFLGRLSPDGRKVLYLGLDPERKGKEKEAAMGLFVLDVRTGKSARVREQPLNGSIMGFCWSPGGRRIAYAWRQDVGPEAPGRQTESHLVVADADGGNPVTIATERGDSRGLITIGTVDWR